MRKPTRPQCSLDVLPTICPCVGLTAKRRKQLHDDIRPFIKDEAKRATLFPDITELPSVCEPPALTAEPVGDEDDIEKRADELNGAKFECRIIPAVQPPVLTLVDAVDDSCWNSIEEFVGRPADVQMRGQEEAHSQISEAEKEERCSDSDAHSDIPQEIIPPATISATNILTSKRPRKEKRDPLYEY